MSAFSTIGIILLVCAAMLFAYQIMAAFLGMGTSDDFVYENINLEDIFSESFLNWVVLLLLCGALLFFLIHMFKGHKHK
jgi:hypothetical protein